MPRSLEPLFGAIKYTLAISQKVLGTAWYAGTYLVILAETIKQVDDTMFGEVNVAYVYEIFVKMSCEILDLCVTFVSKGQSAMYSHNSTWLILAISVNDQAAGNSKRC